LPKSLEGCNAFEAKYQVRDSFLVLLHFYYQVFRNIAGGKVGGGSFFNHSYPPPPGVSMAEE
jgi:hypothetical protein